MTIAVGDGTSGYSGYIDVRDESDSVDSSNLMQFIGVGSNISRKAMRKKIQQIFSLSLFVYVVVISRFFAPLAQFLSLALPSFALTNIPSFPLLCARSLYRLRMDKNRLYHVHDILVIRKC